MKDKTNKIVVKYYFPVLFESLILFYISIIIAKNKKNKAQLAKYLPGKTRSYHPLKAYLYFQTLHHRALKRVVCGGTQTPASSMTVKRV